MSAYHEAFKRNLRKSEAGVILAAVWFLQQGTVVRMPQTQVAQEYEQRMSHMDNGDLLIGGKGLRMEVKQLNTPFTSEADWPQHYRHLVCAVHAYDMAEPKPYGYMHINKHGTHAKIIKADSKPFWEIAEIADSRYGGRKQDTYHAPANCWKYVSLERARGILEEVLHADQN